MVQALTLLVDGLPGVLKNIPNLPSLCGLVQKDPYAEAVFKTYRAEIIEAVIGSSFQKEEQKILRTIAAIRMGTLACATLDDFIDSYMRGEAADEPLSKSMSLEISRKLVELAYNLEDLTNSCINEMLAGRIELASSLLRDRLCISRALWRLELFFTVKQLDKEPSFPFWDNNKERVRNIECRAFWYHLSKKELDAMECMLTRLQNMKWDPKTLYLDSSLGRHLFELLSDAGSKVPTLEMLMNPEFDAQTMANTRPFRHLGFGICRSMD